MVVDTSALIAILHDEPDGPRFLQAVIDAPRRLISAATVLEVSIVHAARTGTDEAFADVDAFLRRARATIRPVSRVHVRLARTAFWRFGKGRHRAGLNFGDCFVYALAHTTGEPLLCKGDDFRHTDLTLDPASLSSHATR
jgi:ribonuclease VapC